MIIKTITTYMSGRAVIYTDDDVRHEIMTDAPIEVIEHPLTCGEEYPFEDEDGKAVRLLA